jgi:hypothetical protein
MASGNDRPSCQTGSRCRRRPAGSATQAVGTETHILNTDEFIRHPPVNASSYAPLKHTQDAVHAQ